MDLLTILSGIALLLIAIKIYSKLSVGWDRSPTCLVGKTAIVTGSNTGIGYYTALDFAKRGAKVILACRNKDKAEEAREKIVKLSGNPHVYVKLIDLSSFESIRTFAKDINENEGRIDILVNNAGVGGIGDKTSKDGLNLVMQVNYYGAFLLTHLLIEKLKNSIPSRVINVSSLMYQFARLDPDNIDAYPKRLFWNKGTNYSNSKLGNICFTVELARRLEGTGVITNCLHPGTVMTDIFRGVKGFRKAIFMFLAVIFFKDPLEGAQTSIYLSVSPDVRHTSGQYFADCAEKSLPRDITQRSFLKKVWENTEKIVNLSPEEKIS